MRVHAHEEPSVQQCADAGIVWQPPIGAWVRIRADLDGRCPEGAHDGDEPGHTGVVVNVRGGCGEASHPYLVLFDDPHPVMTVYDRAVELPVRHYALEELELAQAPA
jgi:hypothetical protein